MMPLEGKNVLVTGSSRGFGKATALKFAGLGANVAVNYSNPESRNEAQEVVNAVRDLGVKSFLVQADVSNAKSVDSMVDMVVSEFGGIDILVNNAGVFPRNPGTATVDLSEEEWDWLMGINLKGVFLCTKAVARHMIARGKGGRIVNVASIAGLIGSRSGCHYGASKGGVIALTYSWADELGKHGILVNAVAPGPVRTKLMEKMSEERWRKSIEETPTGALATPEDVAEAIVFLATAPGVNGQVLVVDNGRVKH